MSLPLVTTCENLLFKNSVKLRIKKLLLQNGWWWWEKSDGWWNRWRTNIRYKVDNLKIDLKAANNALKVDQNRRIYEAMVNEAKTRIGKFKKTGSKISRIIVGTTLPNLMINLKNQVLLQYWIEDIYVIDMYFEIIKLENHIQNHFVADLCLNICFPTIKVYGGHFLYSPWRKI